jgi:outer membrane receptor protein involved in Fe transport
MHLLRCGRRLVCGAALLGLFFSLPAAVYAGGEASITGVVRSGSGAAVPAATVTATGGSNRASTTTDGNGTFSLSVPAGVYRVTVTKAGYSPASAPDVIVVEGTPSALTVTITEQNLSTLRTIGTVSTTGHGSSTINTSAAAQTYVSGAEFTQLANPQINDVLQRIPDVVIEKLGTQADTAIVVGGLQPYETQVLIDGHPLALGQYGVWLTQYFPSYMIGGVETQSGPGNTTPFANIAVAGTVNLQTIPFTKKQTFEMTQGVDNYSSQFTTAVATGSAGKLDYVVSGGTQGSNGPYFGKRECDIYQNANAAAINTPSSAGIVAFCGDFSGSLGTRAQLYKLRYDFSPTTSLDVGFLGSYGGFSPQGSAWGASYGPTKILGCIAGTYECTNPADANLIGKTINGFYWFPGTNIVNTQQLYDAQFRTAIDSTTLLVRPYIGTIQPETYVGNGEGGYPAFYGPPPGYTGPGLPYPGAPALPAGIQIPAGFGTTSAPSGTPTANPFESTACPTGNIYSYNQINSPSNTINSSNGQEECYQYPYSTYERDTLYGTTFSVVHPVEGGNGFLDLTYDYHGQSTFAFANSPLNYQVPMGSATRYSTFSLTGSLAPTPKLGVNFGFYNTDWIVVGSQPTFDSSGNITGSKGLDRTIGRFDPHLALVYRPAGDTSLRASAGTSETFPFVGDVTGPAANQPPAFLYSAGIVTEKNPNLKPEYSSEYDIGADHRFHNGSVLSLDLQDTVVHNVFQQLTTQETVMLNGVPAILGIFTPINVAKLEAKLATLKFVHAPFRGFGYNFALTADRSILSGVPASAYTQVSGTDLTPSPSLPANGVQVCGNAQFTPGLATCIPYLKGYGQFNYTLNTGTFVGIGVDYEGKNNAYYQPPFAVLDLTYHEPFTKTLDFTLSVQNLLNTNSYDYLAAPNLGVPAIGSYTALNGSIQQAPYPTYRIPAPTRTLRVSLRAHVGR